MKRRRIVLMAELVGPDVDEFDREFLFRAMAKAVEDGYLAQPSEPDTIETMLYTGALLGDQTEELSEHTKEPK